MLGWTVARLLGPQLPMDLGVKAGPGWAVALTAGLRSSSAGPLQGQGLLVCTICPSGGCPGAGPDPQGEPQEGLGQAPSPSVLPLTPGAQKVRSAPSSGMPCGPHGPVQAALSASRRLRRVMEACQAGHSCPKGKCRLPYRNLSLTHPEATVFSPLI